LLFRLWVWREQFFSEHTMKPHRTARMKKIRSFLHIMKSWSGVSQNSFPIHFANAKLTESQGIDIFENCNCSGGSGTHDNKIKGLLEED
jgi:hypothetical protein